MIYLSLFPSQQCCDKRHRPRCTSTTVLKSGVFAIGHQIVDVDKVSTVFVPINVCQPNDIFGDVIGTVGFSEFGSVTQANGRIAPISSLHTNCRSSQCNEGNFLFHSEFLQG